MSEEKLKPWYYRTPWRSWLQPLARLLRNAAIGGGFFAGLLWMLVGGPAAVVTLLFMPERFELAVGILGGAAIGAVAGLAVGLYAGRLYGRHFPENRKGPIVLVPISVGLGGFAGLAYTFYGIAGTVGMLLLYVGSYLGYRYIQEDESVA